MRRSTAPPVRRRRVAAALSVGAISCALTGCTAASGSQGAPETPDRPSPSSTPSTPFVVSTNLPGAQRVAVDTLVRVTAESGTLSRVAVRPLRGGKALPGELTGDGSAWNATARLEPGTAYRLVSVGTDGQGQAQRLEERFRTVDLTLDQQTFASIAPLNGETVGVGMPVIVTFDVPVRKRAAIERHLSVSSTPAQVGSWHWLSDTEVHWRPREYWKPGTDVTVRADINSVHAGGGVYGQHDRVSRFQVGSSVVMKVDVARHHMKVFQGGRLLRTLPVSAGKPGFTTRSGIKVIIEKFRYKTMNAATTGISEDDPEYYNIENVEYAQRVTYSGEFLHAAPWSVGSQGSANVSHGCVGMSTSDAAWLYSLTKRGDVVDVVGSDRGMEPTNGYGDWNVPWREYKAGSALS